MANKPLFEGITFYIQSAYKTGIKPHTQNHDDPSNDLIRLVLLHGGTISLSPTNPAVTHIILTCTPPHPKDDILNIKRGGCTLTSAGKAYTDEWLDENGWATFRLVQQFGGMVLPSPVAEGKKGWREMWDGRKVVLQKGWVYECLEEEVVWGREDNWGGWRLRGRYVDEPNPSSSSTHRPFSLGPRPIGPHSDPIFAPGITPFRLDKMDDQYVRSNNEDEEEFNPNLIALTNNRYTGSHNHNHRDVGAHQQQRLSAQRSPNSIPDTDIARKKDGNAHSPRPASRSDSTIAPKSEDNSLDVLPQDPRKLLRASDRGDLSSVHIQDFEPSIDPSSTSSDSPSSSDQELARLTGPHHDQPSEYIATGESRQIPSTSYSPTQEKVEEPLEVRGDTEDDIDGYRDLDCLDSDPEEMVEGEEVIADEQEQGKEAEVEKAVVKRKSFRLSEMRFKKIKFDISLTSNSQSPSTSTSATAPKPITHPMKRGVPSNTEPAISNVQKKSRGDLATKMSKPSTHEALTIIAREMANHPYEYKSALGRRLANVYDGRNHHGWEVIMYRHKAEIQRMRRQMTG